MPDAIVSCAPEIRAWLGFGRVETVPVSAHQVARTEGVQRRQQAHTGVTSGPRSTVLACYNSRAHNLSDCGIETEKEGGSSENERPDSQC